MRDYGVTSLAPYATAPAVGAAGDFYWNTTSKVLFASDGTSWLPVNDPSGWQFSRYPWYGASDFEIMIADALAEKANYEVGTKVGCLLNTVQWWGYVISATNGSNAGGFPKTVTYDSATDTCTLASHGLINGEMVYFTGTPAGMTDNNPYYIIGVTANTFQVSATSGGAAVNMTGATGSMIAYNGTRLTCAPNGDYNMTRSIPLNTRQYSNAQSPPGFPTWFTHSTTQSVNPLTFTGYSANPTGLVYRFKIEGATVTLTCRDNTNGTSNATSLNITLPVRTRNVANAQWLCALRCIDNGAAQAGLSVLQVGPGALTANVFLTGTATNTFTATGGKRIVGGTLVYEI